MVFEQSDACGEDCLNIPSVARVTSSNASKWTYRLKLQANVYPGKHFSFLLKPEPVIGGANFGATSLLHGLADMMDRKCITSSKRHFVRGTDGGSENRSKVMHGVHAMLVQFGVFDTITWARLPPSHSHDFVDRVFSAIED
jgi:hypothetical protein